MRWFLALPVLSMLALPLAAHAQDQPPSDSAGSAAGQYQPGTLPPEPPVIEPPLPGQADNMQPPPDPDDGQPPPPPPPPGGEQAAPAGHDAAMMRKFEARFDAANTTHDGRLTLQQAQDANMRAVVKHFGQIDTKHLGYVTFNQLMAWRMDQMAHEMERRAAALRAQQGQ